MKREERLRSRIESFMKKSGWDKLNEEELMDAVSEQLQMMVKRGQVERLVGEDGEFYYRSTGIFPFGTDKNE